MKALIDADADDVDHDHLSYEPGIYIVTRGSAKVVNIEDGYQAAVLKGGDFFGETDILKCMGYEFFG